MPRHMLPAVLAGAVLAALFATPAPAAQRGEPVVAVVDSGVALGHRALRTRLWTNPGEIARNGVDDDGNGIVDDVHGADFVDGDGRPTDPRGHGTHIAGIIARRSSRRRLGRPTGARIMSLRVIDRTGVGYSAPLARAIDYAVAKGARVINLSIAYYSPAPAVRAALERAGAAGVLVVAAAGNDGEDLDREPVYPASFRTPGMLVVGASSAGGRLARWSARSRRLVDLVAPGVAIRSSLPRGRYGRMSGTSQATARVSRAAAMLLAADSARTAADVRAAILGGADRTPALREAVASGGALDVAGAVRALLRR